MFENAMSQSPSASGNPTLRGEGVAPRSSNPMGAQSADNRSGDENTRGPTFWERHRTLIEVLSLCVTVAFLAGAVVGVVIGQRPLAARAAELKSAPPRVSFDWPALAGLASSAPLKAGDPPRTWVNPEIRESLEKLALHYLNANPLDADALRRTRENLLLTGWFTSDLRLQRAPDGLVSITGTWRVPAAAVRFDGLDYLVAAGGERLDLCYPIEKRGALERAGLRVILNATQTLPNLGEPWAGGEVQHALQLLTYLRGMPGYEQLTGIDVADFSPGRNLVLITDQGNRVIWGGPVDAFNPGQVPALTKAQRLAQFQRTFGRIDAGRPLIDLRSEGAAFVVDAAAALPVTPKDPAPKDATSPGNRRTPAPSRH